MTRLWGTDSRGKVITETPDLGEIEINEAQNLLSIIGPCGVASVAQWCEVEDFVPLKGYLGGTWQQHSIEQITHECFIASEEQLQRFVVKYSLYQKMDATLRKSFQVPLQRLGAAMRRSRPVDRAIDLGISLEALLLSDREAKDSLALPFRLRGAYLLAGTDLEKRKHLERKFNTIYALRSTAVHNGVIPQTLRLEGADQLVSTILTEGTVICADIIMKLLTLGRRPNWTSLILGGEA